MTKEFFGILAKIFCASFCLILFLSSFSEKASSFNSKILILNQAERRLRYSFQPLPNIFL
jgi:hypothetical protein